MMIRVRAVQKYYGAHPAVAGLNFAIADGECIGLLGLNGAGKSTTLMMLGGLLRPTSGTITVRSVSAESARQDMRQLIGYLPETPPLYGDMTVRGYLTFAGGLRGLASSRITSRIGDVAHSCGLLRVLDVQIDSLSHGFQQRVGIAQAILHEPALLILDEPTRGLDPVQIREMRALIRGLRGTHTILLSTHILAEIEAVCDRILVLHDGRLAAQGTEAELTERFGAVGGGRFEIEVRGDSRSLTTAIEDAELLEYSGFQMNIQCVEAAVVRADISADTDVRAEVSRAVVRAGLDLLSLRRTTSGLEDMFQTLGAGTAAPSTAATSPVTSSPVTSSPSSAVANP